MATRADAPAAIEEAGTPFPPLPDDFPDGLRHFVEDVERRHAIFEDMSHAVFELRRQWFVEGTGEARARLDAAIAAADAAQTELEAATATMIEAAGFVPEDFEEAPAAPVGDAFPLIGRASVIGGAPPAAALVEDHLPEAIELLERHAPRGWLEREPRELFRLATRDAGEPVSIVKGVRLGGERPRGHRLRQAVCLARDYLEGDARYDHFAGALALTQLAQLGRRQEALRQVTGHERRIASLFTGVDTDATMLELLVGSACAARGRDMAFVEATSAKSPDLRCRDSFGMVVECKRSAALSDYEVAEEGRMRELFQHVEAGAHARGLFGLFEVELAVEVGGLDLSDVAERCLLQRLVAHPDQPLAYAWGSVAFRPLPSSVALQGPTKAYSPAMLEEVFDWSMELPRWDGLVCKVGCAPAAVTDVARSPIGLAWRVVAEGAVVKRSRAPLHLFARALEQIPRGEFGLVYLAYTEGGRTDIADNRTQAFMERLQGWDHDGGIRVPAAFLVRQYAFPTGDGNPDVVESTVRLLSEESGGGDWIFHEYPSAIYTARELEGVGPL